MTTLAEEQAFEHKAEKMLRGQRELASGRDFRCWVERFRTDINNKDFDIRYDNTFPEAPGTDKWVNNKYCNKCDKLKSWCRCNTDSLS